MKTNSFQAFFDFIRYLAIITFFKEYFMFEVLRNKNNLNKSEMEKKGLTKKVT